MIGVLKYVSRHRLAALGICFVLVLAGVVVWSLCHPRHDPRIEAIRQAGQPVTLAELDASYPRVPDAQNAALVYTNAFALMMFTDSGDTNARQIANIELPPRGHKLAGEDKSELASMMASNAPALRLIDSAQHLTASRYPIDLNQGSLTLLPHLAQLKGAVRLLLANAILQTADGEYEQAVQSLLSAMRLAGSLNFEPLIISELVRIACWAMIAAHLENILNGTTLNEAQLARLQAAMVDAEQPAAGARALAGERASALAIFDEPRFRTLLLTDWADTNPPMTARLKAGTIVTLLQVAGLFQQDRGYLLDAFATNIAAVSLNHPERFQAGQRGAALFNAVPNRFHLFSRMLLPALAAFHRREAEHATRVRVVETALAIERYRLTHANALPATLADLVPAYLKTVPTDPGDGQPLRFKQPDQGYVVYGIGADKTDDGGLERKRGGGASNYDVTFIMAK